MTVSWLHAYIHAPIFIHDWEVARVIAKRPVSMTNSSYFNVSYLFGFFPSRTLPPQLGFLKGVSKREPQPALVKFLMSVMEISTKQCIKID